MASGTAVFVTSQLVSSQVSFLDLTLPVVPSGCLQAVIYPLLSRASSLLWLHLGRALSEGKFLKPLSPCCCNCRSRWCRRFQHEFPNLSLILKTWAGLETIFFQMIPLNLDPLDALKRSLQLSSGCLLVFVRVLTLAINGNSVQQPHGLKKDVFLY